jgi:hypothetical protein
MGGRAGIGYHTKKSKRRKKKQSKSFKKSKNKKSLPFPFPFANTPSKQKDINISENRFALLRIEGRSCFGGVVGLRLLLLLLLLLLRVRVRFLYFLTGAGDALTLLDSQDRPSRRPSPLVAHEGTTYQTLSLSLESCSASVTSCGVMATKVSANMKKGGS